MTDRPWMLYGATGFTGVLVAEEAARRGLRPLLAGRSERKVRELAERLGLEAVAVGLDEPRALESALSRVDLVLHCAGPFVRTSEPMVRACLATRTHYLDITGEVPVLRSVLGRGPQAERAGVALLPGVGFDVVPTDCLARYVADKVPGATTLEVAVAAIGNPSAGTAKSALEMLPRGGLVRRGGELAAFPMGAGARRVRMASGERTMVVAPLGDLETAHRTTGIPNITTLVVPPMHPLALRVGSPVLRRLLAIERVRARAARWLETRAPGPSASQLEHDRSELWARAADDAGHEAQAWLQTVEGYRYTAVIAVLCVQRVLGEATAGALTPGAAFGADFALEVEGTRRYDSLP
jgi:short subunit dehydrogenase-like uncharacterized protein